MKYTQRRRLFIICMLLGFCYLRVTAQPTKLIHFWDFNNTVPLTGLGDVGGNGDSLGNATHGLTPNYTTLPLSGAKIIYTRPHAIQVPSPTRDSVLDNDIDGAFYYDYSSNNYPYYAVSDSTAAAAVCACSGNLCIRARNPSLNSYFYMYVPTMGYMNVMLHYAISATSTRGGQYNIFSYSTNGGVTWNKLTAAMDTFNTANVMHPDTLVALNTITQVRNWYPVQINFTSDNSVNNNGGFIIRFFLAGLNTTGNTGADRYDDISIIGDSICPVLYLQPVNTSVCTGSNTDFVCKVAGGLHDNYQWQADTGTGFHNLTNTAIYNGVLTDSLSLTGVPFSMNGFKYRCVISCASCNTDTSSAAKLTVYQLPNVTAHASATSICLGNNVTLTGGGAVSYTWTGGATNAVPFSPAATNTYTVTGTDAHGCTDTASIKVTVNPLPVVTAHTNHDTVCAGNSVILTGGGAVSYTWTGGATNAVAFVPAATNTYTVTGTDANGCTNTANIIVTVDPLPVLHINPAAPHICYGNNVTLNATGGSTYSWSPATDLSCLNCANPIASPTTTTTYTLKGTTALGCIDSIHVTVTVAAQILAAITGLDTICSRTTTVLTASGGGTYLWSTNATTAAITVGPPVNTTYSVLVTSAGCTDSAKLHMVVNPSPNITLSGVRSVCAGTSTTFSATGGNTYSWNTGATTSSISVTPLATTTYTVHVSNTWCTSDTTITDTVHNYPTPTITPSQAICDGHSITLTAAGGSSYSWNTSATTASITVSPTSTITYSVAVSNGFCITDTNTKITVNPSPIVTITGNLSICQGQNTKLTATGGTIYSWSNSATTSAITVSPPSTGYFSVQVGNGLCTTSDSVNVIVTNYPVPVVSPSQTICFGNSINLSASGGTTYHWLPATGLSSSTSAIPIAGPAHTTTYTVTLANGNCAVKDSIKVIVNPLPPVKTCPDPTIPITQSTPLSVTPQSGNDQYIWSPNQSLSCTDCPDPIASPTITTTYFISVTDSLGCTDVDSVIVYVKDDCGYIYVPNAFSPNGDGHNDYLMVYGVCIEKMDLMIFDRWGNKVFESEAQDKGWDGTYNGQKMNPDTYTYYLGATLADGTKITKSGNVALVR